MAAIHPEFKVIRIRFTFIQQTMFERARKVGNPIISSLLAGLSSHADYAAVYEHRVHRSILFSVKWLFWRTTRNTSKLNDYWPSLLCIHPPEGFPYRSHAMRKTSPWDLIVIMWAQLIHQSSSIEIDLFIHSFKIYLFIYYRVQRVIHARNSDHATN